MALSTLSIPHPRPKKFSDPFHDFAGARLDELIATTDREMTRVHFQQILGPYLPAGTYKESAYFLPMAFDYLLTHDDDALDLVSSVVWFCSEYAARLEEDGALEASRERLRACLDHWMAGFEVIHFDMSACQKKGWKLTYYDHVQHSDVVAEAACDLVRFSAHADLSVDVFTRLARPGASAEAAAWLLEFARQHAVGAPWRPPRQVEIIRVLEDTEVQGRCAGVVKDGLPTFARFPTYWRDTFNALGIEHDVDPLVV